MTGDLVGLLREYRRTLSPETAEKLLRVIQPHIHLFILGRAPEAVDDIRLSTMVEIAFNLVNIKADAVSAEIWSWCYTIARRKLAAYCKKQNKEILVFVSPEDLIKLSDAAARYASWASPDQRAQDLEGIAILKGADPECFELLWDRHVVGMPIEELAFQKRLTYDAMRMKISRCRDGAEELLNET